MGSSLSVHLISSWDKLKDKTCGEVRNIRTRKITPVTKNKSGNRERWCDFES